MKNSKIEYFKDGEIIKKSSEDLEYICIIKKGEVELSQEDKIYATLAAGEIFGETHFILEKPIEFEAKAIGEVELEKVNPRIFDAINCHPDLQLIKQIFQSIAEKIRYYETTLLELNCYKEKIQISQLEKGIILRADTPKAKRLLNNMEEMEIKNFPFRVGRFTKRTTDKLFHKNDLYLLDKPPYSVSRSHFEIIRKDEKYYFCDRGSKLGTIVNRTRIGAKKDNLATICLDKKENTIMLGNKTDNVRFSIIID